VLIEFQVGDQSDIEEKRRASLTMLVSKTEMLNLWAMFGWEMSSKDMATHWREEHREMNCAMCNTHKYCCYCLNISIYSDEGPISVEDVESSPNIGWPSLMQVKFCFKYLPASQQTRSLYSL
jgi:hypothetical protein